MTDDFDQEADILHAPDLSQQPAIQRARALIGFPPPGVANTPATTPPLCPACGYHHHAIEPHLGPVLA